MNRKIGEEIEGVKEEGNCQLTCMPNQSLTDTHCLSRSFTQKHQLQVDFTINDIQISCRRLMRFETTANTQPKQLVQQNNRLKEATAKYTIQSQ